MMQNNTLLTNHAKGLAWNGISVSETGDGFGSVPAMLAQIGARFPWGVLLVTDRGSKEEIPQWVFDDDQVAVCASAVVVKVLHGDEGSASVRVWRGAGKLPGFEAFSGAIEVMSGVLQVSDALGDQHIEVSVPQGTCAVRIYLDEPRDASTVDIFLSAEGN